MPTFLLDCPCLHQGNAIEEVCHEIVVLLKATEVITNQTLSLDEIIFEMVKIQVPPSICHTLLQLSSGLGEVLATHNSPQAASDHNKGWKVPEIWVLILQT